MESSTLMRYWYSSYPEVLFRSSHRAFPADLPNLLPYLSSTRGMVKP